MQLTQRALRNGRSAGRVRHILLYGTLCASEPAHADLGLGTALAPLGNRTLRATLYDLGAYPGLVLGRGMAAAELYRIEDGTILRRLDAYEGFDPRKAAQSLFVRTSIRLPPAAGARGPIEAWIYLYNGRTGRLREVPGGSWPAYRAARAGVICRCKTARRSPRAGRRS